MQVAYGMSSYFAYKEQTKISIQQQELKIWSLWMKNFVYETLVYSMTFEFKLYENELQ